MTNVHVAGVGMTPFTKALDSSVPGLAADAVGQALQDSGLAADRVGMVFFGNAMGGTMTGQEMIRAKAGLGRTDFAALGTPMVAVENACASSSSAVHLASMAVASGQVDIALAVGAEKMTAPDKTLAFKGLASAVDLERVAELEEALYGGSPENAAGTDRSLFMDIYADMARRYTERSGATPEDFARVAVKAHRHGALNPHAQYRNLISVDEVLASRRVSDPLTLLMCSPIGDGAAAVVLCSDAVARDLEDTVRLRASVLVSGIRGPEVVEPASTRASRKAYEMAGIGPDDLDVVELHDAAAPAELIISEELGLCGSGEAPKMLADGETTLGGRLPINTSGGLLSKGHPVGATGCAQIVELTDQLRGRAGDRQVEGAQIGLAENGGGYLGDDPAAVVVTILSRD